MAAKCASEKANEVDLDIGGKQTAWAKITVYCSCSLTAVCIWFPNWEGSEDHALPFASAESAYCQPVIGRVLLRILQNSKTSTLYLQQVELVLGAG